MLRLVRLRSGYGKVKRPDIAVDNVHDRGIPDTDGKHGIQNANGQGFIKILERITVLFQYIAKFFRAVRRQQFCCPLDIHFHKPLFL